MRKAICDTSPLQYLHQIGFLHLLAEFYAETVIPPAVVSELERGKAIGVDLPDVRELPWLKIQAPEGMDKVPTVADLGAGEKEVLALGLQLPGAVVILDERQGRLHAEALELAFTGTLGILLRAKVEGRIPRIDPLLAHLDRLGFRLSVKTHAAVLRQAVRPLIASKRAVTKADSAPLRVIAPRRACFITIGGVRAFQLSSRAPKLVVRDPLDS